MTGEHDTPQGGRLPPRHRDCLNGHDGNALERDARTVEGGFFFDNRVDTDSRVSPRGGVSDTNWSCWLR